jgi:hypothetical protein
VDLLSGLRAACAHVAERALHVRLEHGSIRAYAASLPLDAAPAAPDPATHIVTGSREQLAAFWLTLDAINFGSGWFPTLRKLPGRPGYFTIASGLRNRFAASGPWSVAELTRLTPADIAAALGQDREHELMGLFARSLNDLGGHIAEEHGGRFAAVVDAAAGSAVALVERLARWDCFADSSTYDGLAVPFLKRAQIAAADLAGVGVLEAGDLDRLTMFADNLVPHVLRVDGVLSFEAALVERIERGELIEHGCPEEVEIRACALHAVELIVASGSATRAADVDRLLWHRGQGARYKASPRHRSRATAY